MNIELTTACPLQCPQCYCSLIGGKHIDLQTAKFWIKEAAANDVVQIMLSGGETLCYPHIYEIVAAASKYCEVVNIALSGFDFTQDVLDGLIKAGVSGIFISLNGSTEKINAFSRDGYYLAIDALQLLSDNKFPNIWINWVMHSSNADDFANIIEISEKYNVKHLVVMAFKPDSANNLLTIPTKSQMHNVRDIIKAYKGNVKILLEPCFSPMLALISETKLFGNLNVGKNKGCGAGRDTFSINVDGNLSPCRHLDYFEEHTSLEDYWNNSPILKRLREIEDDKREPCSSCYYSDYCRHCLAINAKMKGELYIGNETCPLQTPL